MKIALTGHRPKRLNSQEKEIAKWISEQLISNRYEIEEVYSGMAQGADQIFAKTAQELNIPVICCYPYKKKRFHQDEKDIIDKAKDVRFISEKYTGNKVYWIRDKYMVDNCDLLLAVFDGIKEGGTWLTIDYANRIGKPIEYFNIRQKD
jgi:uncharacterized phage-like protein YoqJ